MRPDRSLISDLFDSDSGIVKINPKAPIKNKSSKPKEKANDSNKARFMQKLADELFSQFDHKDWFQYFVHKAQEQNVKYLTRNYAKEYAIIKSIMGEMTWRELKDMIDFVFDSNQDMVEKRTVGLWILSKGWINSVYQNTLLWKEGKYKPKTAPKRNREWQPEVAIEASRKEIGGLNYGKPIREKETEEPDAPVTKKNGRIYL